MKVRYIVAMALGLAVSTSAMAGDGEALFKKGGCNACHALNKKMVGPAFTAVAAKYAGDAGAQAKLEAKVRGGGSGSFGAMPMPPTPARISDAEIKELVTFALSQK
jgi:cytochrome c